MPWKEAVYANEGAQQGTWFRWYNAGDFSGKNHFMISKNEEGVKSVWNAEGPE